MGNCRGTGGKSTYSMEIKRAIGDKHEPIDAADALERANPNYSTGKEKWTRNCQRVVFAYEMMRRGYNVTALPRDLSGNDTLPYIGDGGLDQVMKGGTLIDIPRLGDQAARITQIMSGYGSGARAIVRVQWKGKKSGHVFIAENFFGTTYFIDPQTNQWNVAGYFDKVKKSKTKIMRIDNLEPTDLIAECVRQVHEW